MTSFVCQGGSMFRANTVHLTFQQQRQPRWNQFYVRNLLRNGRLCKAFLFLWWESNQLRLTCEVRQKDLKENTFLPEFGPLLSDEMAEETDSVSCLAFSILFEEIVKNRYSSRRLRKRLLHTLYTHSRTVSHTAAMYLNLAPIGSDAFERTYFKLGSDNQCRQFVKNSEWCEKMLIINQIFLRSSSVLILSRRLQIYQRGIMWWFIVVLWRKRPALYLHHRTAGTLTTWCRMFANVT